MHNSQVFQKHFIARQEQVLTLTRSLVEIESPSGDEKGSRDVVSTLIQAAESISGVSCERVPAVDYGEHLRITAFCQTNAKPIVLLGHTDTVHPRGSLAQRPWRVEDGKAFGPGVFDMKANCALAVEILRAFSEVDAQPAHPIEVLLTCDEENGSPTGRALVEAAAKNAKAVLVLEPPAANGSVKTGRKGTGIFSLEALGRAAHAGLEPEKGASAILELARQTVELHTMNGMSSGISVNVGVIAGGTLSNVVPAQARADVDVRFATAAEARTIEERIRSLQPFDERVRLKIGGGINRPPLERSKKVLELYARAKQIAHELGFELGEAQVGGASDGNFAAAAGAAVLDGLGICGDGAHATHEHIVIDDIPRRGALLAALISSF